MNDLVLLGPCIPQPMAASVILPEGGIRRRAVCGPVAQPGKKVGSAMAAAVVLINCRRFQPFVLFDFIVNSVVNVNLWQIRTTPVRGHALRRSGTGSGFPKVTGCPPQTQSPQFRG